MTQKPKLTRLGCVQHLGAAAAVDSPKAQPRTRGGSISLRWAQEPSCCLGEGFCLCLEEGSFPSSWSVWRKCSMRSASSTPSCKRTVDVSAEQISYRQQESVDAPHAGWPRAAGEAETLLSPREWPAPASEFAHPEPSRG